jgi:ABC-type sugar transport system substrate-binding protein
MKRTIALILALCMALCLCACGGTSTTTATAQPSAAAETPAEKPLIGLSMHNQTETWAVQFKDSFVEAAEAAGYEVTVTDANSDPSAQVKQIDDLVAMGVKALVVLPAGYTALGSALKSAKDAGIPIVNADSKVAEADQQYVDCFITADCYGGGEACGEYLASVLPENATIGTLNYPQLSVIAERFTGLADALHAAGRDDVKIIEKDVTDLSAIASYTEDMLMANPEICGFVCLNDNTALSCYGACKQLDHADAIVIGFDGSPAGKQSIAANEMTGTMVYSPIELAKASAAAADAILTGKTFEKETKIDMTMINRDNIKDQDLENWS